MTDVILPPRPRTYTTLQFPAGPAVFPAFAALTTLELSASHLGNLSNLTALPGLVSPHPATLCQLSRPHAIPLTLSMWGLHADSWEWQGLKEQVKVRKWHVQERLVLRALARRSIRAYPAQLAGHEISKLPKLRELVLDCIECPHGEEPSALIPKVLPVPGSPSSPLEPP